ncbi:iron-sulfur cluster assembly 1 homolog, mitochondrial [Fukomys damarensis]|uniref:iron-sulfur cluster assembly 1 homolog, mitochondrial n=1 Tax=Fukomys damarensis TaxID=885580 RepID=UPI00053F4390|nr:iron-sulfur cluster assembly 1 homolog, mitochondrial [Fukomys damarensis]
MINSLTASAIIADASGAGRTFFCTPQPDKLLVAFPVSHGRQTKDAVCRRAFGIFRVKGRKRRTPNRPQGCGELCWAWGPPCRTPSAVNKIKQLLKDKPEHVGLKVGVRTRGCNGLSYTLEYTKTKGDSDEEVVQDGVRVFIEKKAQLTLLGTEMDYVEDKLSSEFVFNNPNIKGTCGCGESFNI